MNTLYPEGSQLTCTTTSWSVGVDKLRRWQGPLPAEATPCRKLFLSAHFCFSSFQTHSSAPRLPHKEYLHNHIRGTTTTRQNSAFLAQFPGVTKSGFKLPRDQAAAGGKEGGRERRLLAGAGRGAARRASAACRALSPQRGEAASRRPGPARWLGGRWPSGSGREPRAAARAAVGGARGRGAAGRGGPVSRVTGGRDGGAGGGGGGGAAAAAAAVRARLWMRGGRRGRRLRERPPRPLAPRAPWRAFPLGAGERGGPLLFAAGCPLPPRLASPRRVCGWAGGPASAPSRRGAGPPSRFSLSNAPAPFPSVPGTPRSRGGVAVARRQPCPAGPGSERPAAADCLCPAGPGPFGSGGVGGRSQGLGRTWSDWRVDGQRLGTGTFGALWRRRRRSSWGTSCQSWWGLSLFWSF